MAEEQPEPRGNDPTTINFILAFFQGPAWQLSKLIHVQQRNQGPIQDFGEMGCTNTSFFVISARNVPITKKSPPPPSLATIDANFTW